MKRSMTNPCGTCALSNVCGMRLSPRPTTAEREACQEAHEIIYGELSQQVASQPIELGGEFNRETVVLAIGAMASMIAARDGVAADPTVRDIASRTSAVRQVYEQAQAEALRYAQDPIAPYKVPARM